MDGVVIHDMIKGGPAERSGKIYSGDLLVEINGQTVEGVPYEEVLKRLQGEGKEKIQLGLRRSSGNNELHRYTGSTSNAKKLVMQDDRVKYSFERYGDGIIGKINLPSFYESGEGSNCEVEMREALRILKKQGNLFGLVLRYAGKFRWVLESGGQSRWTLCIQWGDRHFQICTWRNTIFARS